MNVDSDSEREEYGEPTEKKVTKNEEKKIATKKQPKKVVEKEEKSRLLNSKLPEIADIEVDLFAARLWNSIVPMKNDGSDSDANCLGAGQVDSSRQEEGKMEEEILQVDKVYPAQNEEVLVTDVDKNTDDEARGSLSSNQEEKFNPFKEEEEDIEREAEQKKNRFPVLCLTATSSYQSRQDIVASFNLRPENV